MNFVPLIVAFVTIALLGAITRLEEALFVGILAALATLPWVIGRRERELQRQIDRLREQLGELRRAPQDNAARAAEAEPFAEPDTAPALVTPAPVAASRSEDTAGIAEAETAPPSAGEAPAAPSGGSRPVNPVDRFEDLLRRGGQSVVAYFTDGNVFVRVGLLLLFFGVAFLLKYAAENSRIPLEFRFMGAAAGGLALLAAGWRLRRKKPVYALLLQGGGIGIVYITIFAAYQLAGLLPPLLTFTLMVFLSAFTVALALLQDSRALAVFAVVGGFLAPLLASSGSGNYVGLFSYYAILNAGVFAVAWIRAWRLLNLLGFAFTFGVFVLWVVFDYDNTDLWPGVGFALLFFGMYSLIGVLYALRQPGRLTGLVDGTIVFGTPVVVSGLLMAMLRDYDYGIAGASAGMGFYYLLLARYCWHRVGPELRLLAEALLAIGVVFATLAIPYALDGHWSSAAWALEAAGILWVSIRQNRFYAQCFAILLQIGAALLFLLRNFDDVGTGPWLNPAFIGGVFVALGAFVSARMLYVQGNDFRLRLLHIPFYVWAMGWWLASALLQIHEYFAADYVAGWLLLFGATAVALVYVDRVRGWNWMPASINAALLLPLLVLIWLVAVAEHDHALILPDAVVWAAILVANYWMIARLETVAWPRWINLAAHTVFVLFAGLLLSFELLWHLFDRVGGAGDGYIALLPLGWLLALRAARGDWLPALRRFGAPLRLGLAATAAALIACWSLLVNLANSGDPAPLPYLPLLNPLDLAHLAFFVLVLSALRLLTPAMAVQREHVLILLAALAFVWLTAVLIRSMHHYAAIPFDLERMLGDTRVQSAISILWTLIGMGAMLIASKRALRTLWIAAATLVGVVLVKMLFVDLGASGTVERIVSFLVVGGLLVATGYFSPIPRRADAAPGESSHA